MNLIPPTLTMPDPFTFALIEDGYENVRLLSTGEYAATLPQMFTTGIFVGLDAVGYRLRYCYEQAADAIAALQAWDGVGDPPGPWIKEKPSGRLGPGATA